ncbi:unnamed protein product, partial [Rotaria sp. Silwood2]
MQVVYKRGKDGSKTIPVRNKIANNTDLREWETVRSFSYSDFVRRDELSLIATTPLTTTATTTQQS